MGQIVENVMEIARCIAQYRIDSLVSLGLKSCHASYLREICATPGISQDKLAQRIYINKSNVARQVAVLEEEGFVRRTVCACDKRVIELYPTQKALAVLPQILSVLDYCEGFLTEGLSPSEMATLGILLDRLKKLASEDLKPKTE